MGSWDSDMGPHAPCGYCHYLLPHLQASIQQRARHTQGDQSREHHPDVSSGAQAGARFHEVAEAYEVLHDPARRAHYDRANRPVAAPRRPASDVPRFIDDEPPAARYDMPGPIRLSIRIDLGLFLRWPRW